jgi:hypothetical protein
MALALVLNEMFGMPPAFTSALPEPSPVAGVWSSGDIALTISPDGSVFGVFGKEQVYRAKVSANRTWMGRALNWRTDYIIIGRVGEHRFTAPFNIREGHMDLAMFVLRDEVKPGPARLQLRRKT